LLPLFSHWAVSERTLSPSFRHSAWPLLLPPAPSTLQPNPKSPRIHQRSTTKRSRALRFREAIGNAHLDAELLDAVALLLDHPAERRHFLLQSGDLRGELLRIGFLQGGAGLGGARAGGLEEEAVPASDRGGGRRNGRERTLQDPRAKRRHRQ
jgi:hypothetical protein